MNPLKNDPQIRPPIWDVVLLLAALLVKVEDPEIPLRDALTACRKSCNYAEAPSLENQIAWAYRAIGYYHNEIKGKMNKNESNPWKGLKQRNPDRIPEVLNELQSLWELKPDLRLGQLINNLCHGDPFYIEDTKLIEAIKKAKEEWVK